MVKADAAAFWVDFSLEGAATLGVALGLGGADALEVALGLRGHFLAGTSSTSVSLAERFVAGLFSVTSSSFVISN